MSTINGRPIPRTRDTSKAERTRILMELARKAGWRGKSYRKAKRFDRALTRNERFPRTRLDPITDLQGDLTGASIVVRARRKVARLIKRGGK